MDFLFEKHTFSAYGPQHFIPLLIIFTLGLISILWSKYKLNKSEQLYLIFIISLVPFAGYFTNLIFPIIEGDFSLKEDLPIHICRFIAVSCPFVIWFKNRFWMGIFYFWILAGTINANITPDVEFGFPHWSYFNYWMVHSFLIIIPIYYVVIFRLNIQFKDIKNAFWVANGFLVITFFLNLALDSNYMYSKAKPDSSSILDYMGPWPIYLISTQLLALILFTLLYLPFYFKNKKST